MVVLLVGLEVLREIVDALGKQGHLNFGGAGVAVVLGELGEDVLLIVFRDSQGDSPSLRDNPETQ